MGKSRRMQRLCDYVSGTQEEIWHILYGTNAVGQLPQFNKLEHEGHSWHPCPYSTQCSDLQTRHLLGLSDTDPLPTKVDHTDVDGRIYYMKTQNRLSWGYECTFDGCTYFLTNGEHYFYN